MSELHGEPDVAAAEAAWIACAGAAVAVADRVEAARKWAEALRIARLELPPGHPFLLPSLVHHALALAEREPALAWRLIDEAIACAHGLARDVDALACHATARSSTFHLRLEAKHPGAYTERRRHALGERLDGVVRFLAGLRDGRGPPAQAPDPAAIAGAGSTVELALACLPHAALR